MTKTIFIINGAGGVGKDTLIDALNEKYDVRNVSSITPIKELAREGGWTGGKDLKSRKFLSDLKALFTEFNDLPFEYCKYHCERFMESTEDFLFVCIREPKEIEKLYQYLMHKNFPVKTLLIRREEIEKQVYGNKSDDDVLKYPYQYIFNNETSLEEAGKNFTRFIETITNKN